MTNPADSTPDASGHDSTAAQPHVSGGDPDRLDSPGEGSGGLPSAGADGETGAREQLRKDLGERPEQADVEGGGDLAEPLGATDDPQGGSIQEHGARP